MPYKKGESGNLLGRPRVPEIELIRKAIAETEKEKKKSLWKHLIEQCFEDNNVLRAVANKFVPDMTMIKMDPESNKIIIEFKSEKKDIDVEEISAPAIEFKK